MLLQSAADRFVLLDSDFNVLDEEMMGEGAANHDAISTADGKYALLSVRQAIADKGTDGQLQLYDIEAKEMVGNPVSACFACHDEQGIEGNAVLCGADVVWDDHETPPDVTQTGVVYVAGMGGHFAKATVSLDTDAGTLAVTDLKRIRIGSKDTHPTHDPRVDVTDTNKMFWSTYKLDGDNVHVGVSDLSTGKVIKDVALPLDARATSTGSLYCGSGQSKDSFIPVTMTHEAYIDVFSKADLDAAPTRVFLAGVLADDKYKFFHGTNTRDLKSFAVAINTADAAHGTVTGIKMLELDMADLEAGTATVLKEGTLSGGTTFRQSYTYNDEMLLQSAADRFYLLDADDFSVLDEEMMVEGAANHDAIAVPGGKYAILSVRQAIADKGTDGQLQLYDIEKKEMVGDAISVCFACHDDSGIEGNAVLCGADVVWN
jgi:cytochrome c553